jgi:hypothetical protein
VIAATNRHPSILLPWAACAAFALAIPSAADERAPVPVPATGSKASEADDASDEDDPWERLTERPDKRRPREPFQIDVDGRPLVLGGEYEIDLGYLRNRSSARTRSSLTASGSSRDSRSRHSTASPAASLFAQVSS